MVIGPPLSDPSTNAQLIPNTWAVSAWAIRQNLGYAEWRANLNGWVVHGGNVPIEWPEKNTIVEAPESNLATSATKSSSDKSPPPGDKPKKVRCKRASAKKPKISSLKPLTITQSGSGAALITKSSILVAASASTLSPLKQYRRKTSAGRVKLLESSKEVFSQSPYLLTSFLSLFFFLCLYFWC